MINKQVPSPSNQPPVLALPSVDSLNFHDAVVGGGDQRIADLVNEARAQGYTIQERTSGPLGTELGHYRPPGFEKAGD